MTQDVLKYLQPNAAIPIDMETTSLLVNTLKKALAEPAMSEVQRLGQEIEQEPVAVYGYCPECGAKGVIRERRPNGDDKCANGHTYPSSTSTPPQRTEQEPVAYLCENAVGHRYFRWKKPSSTYKPIALYTAPPQRKPLTDKVITQVINSMPKKMKGFMVDWDLYEFARAIEAKLKERNT